MTPSRWHITRPVQVLSTAIVLCASIAGSTVRAELFLGNGNTGFGGAVGNGSLLLTNDGTTISGTFTRGTSGNFNDALVLYFDSVSGGFSTTSSFNDQLDDLRKAVSGVSGSNRSTLTFPSGFSADYAVALKPTSPGNFGGLWSLANGGDNSLGFITSVSLSPNNSNNAANYTFSFAVSQLGLTPNTATTISLLGSYVSATGFRSTEAVAGGVSGTQGHFPFTSFSAGTLAIVPEPGSLTLLGMAGCLGLASVHRLCRRRSPGS